MERIDQIMSHPIYKMHQRQIEELEVNRIFCKHGMHHSLDVARILYIKVLEAGLDISKDMVYAVALLHDIGRAVEYENGISHHEAGADIAREILIDCGFSFEECQPMLKAISSHKELKASKEDVLCKLLYEADKLSRNCFDCKAITECYWSDEQKNYQINY